MFYSSLCWESNPGPHHCEYWKYHSPIFNQFVKFSSRKKVMCSKTNWATKRYHNSDCHCWLLLILGKTYPTNDLARTSLMLIQFLNQNGPTTLRLRSFYMGPIESCTLYSVRVTLPCLYRERVSCLLLHQPSLWPVLQCRSDCVVKIVSTTPHTPHLISCRGFRTILRHSSTHCR